MIDIKKDTTLKRENGGKTILIPLEFNQDPVFQYLPGETDFRLVIGVTDEPGENTVNVEEPFNMMKGNASVLSIPLKIVEDLADTRTLSVKRERAEVGVADVASETKGDAKRDFLKDLKNRAKAASDRASSGVIVSPAQLLEKWTPSR